MLQLNDKTDNGSQSYYIPQHQAKKGLIIIAVIILFLLLWWMYSAGVSKGESYLRGIAADPFQHHEFHEIDAPDEFESDYVEHRHERYSQPQQIMQQPFMPPIIINNRND